MSTGAAAWQLGKILITGGKRKVSTALLFLAPLVLALLFRLNSTNAADLDYAGLILGFYTVLYVPFLGIYWGSAVLTDEIDGKTLVFLWTRPTSRMSLMLLKLVSVAAWYIMIIAGSLLLTYLIVYSREGVEAVLRSIAMPLWDIRAMGLGGLAYLSLAFFLSSIFKKPLVVGLLYTYFWDSIVMFLPSFLKRFSLRHYLYTLGTHPPKEEGGDVLKLLSESTTTETQAILTLVTATLVFAFAGAWLIRRREFGGDDPGRA